MHEMMSHTRELLTAICRCPATVRELEDRGVQIEDMRAGVKNLQTHGYIEGSKLGKTATIYSATRRGHMLAKTFALGTGEVAAPRQTVLGGPSFVSPAMRCTRPQDEPHPSRENGEIVEHKRPVIIGAKVQPLGGR